MSLRASIELVVSGRSRALYRQSDCVQGALALTPDSVDLVLTDPIYPEIARHYGRISEADWLVLMARLVEALRPAMKPSGSMVFILRPNSERVGKMRPWLWKFLVWASERWPDFGVVQDHYWWNPTAMPTIHCNREHGLMRGSVTTDVWLGPSDCYRNQDEVLWEPSQAAKIENWENRALTKHPSGHHIRHGRACQTAMERGGSTPFNLLPLANTNSTYSAGTLDHGGGTPAPLCNWWIRYASPPGGLVVDPFAGSGTVLREADKLGRRAIGFDINPNVCTLAEI